VRTKLVSLLAPVTPDLDDARFLRLLYRHLPQLVPHPGARVTQEDPTPRLDQPP
jgi:hypothetical protein